MIATETPVGRAAGILTVLAASALVCQPAPASRDAHALRIETATPEEVSTSSALPAMEIVKPYIDGSWQGTCRAGELGWPDMPVTVDLRLDLDGGVHATGTLAFIGRRTHAHLRGRLWDGHIRLHGDMTEIGGLGTVWQIEVRGDIVGGDHLEGRFIEVTPGTFHDGTVMCTFDWRR